MTSDDVKAHMDTLSLSDLIRFVDGVNKYKDELVLKGKKKTAEDIKKQIESAGLTVEELSSLLGITAAKPESEKSDRKKRESTTYSMTYKGKPYTVVNVGAANSEVKELLELITKNCNLSEPLTKRKLFEAIANNTAKDMFGITDLTKI
ncbi:hypothetical protein [Serratia marcescens]|uniref:hypothetical protein n=1 Tax=Serratia marcescens TaxID=615 RepID=UPI000668A6C2|nr:hypothetical protein [Serratia marcescens]BEN87063.1 hypothetical protein SMQC07_08620 [Serratia marcescens]BEN92250.1 hypothetical protein SMQC08_08630 [Serratia marcescens]BEN97576.1 hypothetical protein SMQC11_08650 [Serratia marcescens]